jgi:hypothetical protein
MLKSLPVLTLILLFFGPIHAQEKYTAASIHSHNDYSRPDAFYHAFNAGVGAIEADVYLRNGKLIVAHDTSHIKQALTLEKMYLEPIRQEMRDRPRPFNFIIDLKGDYAPIMTELLRELQPLSAFINTGSSKAPLMVIITGNRPPPSGYKNYPSYISFDDDLQLPHTPDQWKRVAQVSLNFANYSKWKGEGALPQQDEKVLKSVINAVHQSGRKIRFWGAPDTPACWQKLMEFNADILSTDMIDKLLVEITTKK